MKENQLADLTENYDVLIAGAGPAGSLAARQLSKLGFSVLLVERSSFPRQKVCGCCLNPAAVHLLEDIGLGQVTTLGLELNRLRLRARGRCVELHTPGGLAISREKLDSELAASACREGAIFLDQTRASLLQSGSNDCKIQLRSSTDSRIVRAQVALCADGLGGDFFKGPKSARRRIKPTSRIGAGALFSSTEGPPPGTIDMSVSQVGYLGLVRLPGKIVDAAAAIDTSSLKNSSLSAVARQIVEEAGGLPPRQLDSAEWKGTPPLTGSRPKLGQERVFILGDAAAYLEPFTGEGMTWALYSAQLVIPLVERSLADDQSDLVEEWTRTYFQALQPRRRLCAFLSRALRKPRIVTVALALLNLNTAFAGPVIRQVNRPLKLEGYPV